MKDSKSMFNCYTNKVNSELTKNVKGAECKNHDVIRCDDGHCIYSTIALFGILFAVVIGLYFLGAGYIDYKGG
jgi:hypothetical protein